MIVTAPSHKTAKVLEFLPENISSFISDESQHDISLLTENIDELVVPDGNESIYEYLDRLIIESFRQMKPIEFKY